MNTQLQDVTFYLRNLNNEQLKLMRVLVEPAVQKWIDTELAARMNGHGSQVPMIGDRRTANAA